MNTARIFGEDERKKALEYSAESGLPIFVTWRRVGPMESVPQDNRNYSVVAPSKAEADEAFRVEYESGSTYLSPCE